MAAHTAYADETYVREMVPAGARGYLLKGDVSWRTCAICTRPRSTAQGAGGGNADLSSTVARLEEVDRLKDEFLAMVSHEPRTPITVVLGMAQTLVGRPDMAATADGQEILQRVVRQASGCATWSSSSSRRARSWPTAARCCGPRGSRPPR